MTVYAIGKFDALHLGHRALAAAAAQLGEAVLLGFSGMAQELGWPPRPPLLGPAERAAVLAAWRAQLGCQLREEELPFAAVRRMQPATFVDFLQQEQAASGIVVGADFRFGYRRAGDAASLQQLCAARGLACRIVPPVQAAGVLASSSAVRRALRAGRIELVTALLGRQHACRGEVVRGDGRGRQLGFPTANLQGIASLLPGPGVYAAWAEIDAGAPVPAAVNIGVAPTIGTGRPTTVEAHLLDWQEDIYGQQCRLRFDRHLRGEQCFASLQELQAAIAADVAAVRTWAGAPAD